jgi:hypothetical protein
MQQLRHGTMLDGHHRPDEPPALPVQARDSELLGQWAHQFR